MVEHPSGVAASQPRQRGGARVLFAGVRSERPARHEERLGREYSGALSGDRCRGKPISSSYAAKVRLGKYAGVCLEIIPCADRPGSTGVGATPLQHNDRLIPIAATVLVRILLLNCNQRDINFADHAARLELHSRRAGELLREAFFDEKHPEASARRLSNARPS